MATKYCRAAGGNWNTDATWSTTSSAGTANTTKPTAADDVILDVGSATIAPLVIDAASVCRSLNCTGFINTLTHNAFTLTIGDSTAGASNVALTLVSGMTYTLSNVTTSALSFISTSATQQTIAFGGKTVGNFTINGAGSNYALTSAMTTGSTATVTLSAGTLHTDGAADNSNLTHSWGKFATSGTRTLTLGNSIIGITSSNSAAEWNASVAGYTLNKGTSTLNFTGSVVSFFGGNGTYYDVNFSGMSSVAINNTNTYHNFSCSGASIKTAVITFNTPNTVTNTLTFAGQSVTNRLFVAGVVIGNQITMTNTGATQVWSNVDFRDFKLSSSYNASAITGNSGDCGGNSGITFTSPVSQTSTGTSSFTWSTHGWTTRVPLPQDDVTVNNTFSASQVVTVDMPRLGKNVTFSSNTVGLTCNVVTSVFGSWSVNANAGLSNWTATLTLEGRSSYTITNSGVTRDSLVISAPGGTYTLQDAISIIRAGGSTFTLNSGTFDANNFNVSSGVVSITGTLTRALTMGSGTWSYATSSASGTPWNAAVTTGLTFNANTSTIKCITNSSNTKPFSGGGLTYNNLWLSDAGTGVNQMLGSNTFNNLKIDPGRTLNFTAGITTTVTSATISGTSGSLVTLGSITAASHTLTKSGGGQMGFDWMSISRSIATPSTTWYAGSNSTDGGNNSGWVFANLTGDAVVQTVATSVLAPTVILSADITVNPTLQSIATSVLAPTIIAEVDITVTPSVLSVATSILSPTESGTANVTPTLLTVSTSILSPTELWDSTVIVSTLQVTDNILSPTIVSDYTATPTIQTVSTSVLAPTELWDSTVVVTEQEISTSVVNPLEVIDVSLLVAILTILTETITPSERLDITVTPTVLAVATFAVMPSIENGGDSSVSPSIQIIATTVNSPIISIDSTVIPLILTVATSIINPTITASVVVSPTIQTVLTDINSPSEIIDALISINVLNVNTSILSPVFEGDVTIQPSTLTIITSIENPSVGSNIIIAAQILEILTEILDPNASVVSNIIINPEVLSILTEVLSPKIPTNKGIHLNVTVDKERNLNIKVTKYVSLNILKDSIHN